MNISARNKGLITGLLMVGISVIIYLLKKDFDNPLQYIVYASYVAGIIWTLFTFKKETGEASFKQYFSEGFKCFIMVTLLMVLFTLVFILTHPELKEKMAEMTRSELAKSKNMMPSDIEERVAMAKKAFLPGFLMIAVFSYLVIGSLVTLIAAGFLAGKKNN
jgi:NADH:ubiquinone oxidoreductase subunit 6 (subunit J)